MFPAYRYMDPYPETFLHPRDHNPHPYHHYPSWEQMPPHMGVDSSKPPSSFGPWSYYGTNDHPNPTEGRGCCNHSYPPGYYSFRPFYPPDHQPLPPFYYHGLYPPYHDSYPPYFVPPPHHPADQPRYDHEKARGHCCGCPNHTCLKADNRGVQIEEHKPETEQQDSNSSSLIRLPNYPYPVLWMPSNLTKDKESNKDSELQPVSWNGWVPLDINSLKGSRQGGDEKKSPQSEEKRTQFPWPTIWMPDYDKPKEPVKDLKEVNASPRAAEGAPVFKIIPLKFLENENREEKPGVAEDAPRTGGEEEEPKTQARSEAVAPKESKTKIIPVKRMEDNEEKKFGMEEKVKEMGETKPGFPEKLSKENGAEKSSDGKQSSPKASKLPPVCLRVDPLPRRKNGNGSSRSPSTPSLKEKEKAHQESKEPEPEVKKTKAEIPKKEIKVVDVKDGSSVQRHKEEQQSQDTVPVASVNDASGNATAKKSSEVEGKQKTVESLDKEKSNGGEHKEEDRRGVTEGAEGKMKEEKKVTRILSPSDAALLIQSAYKGYQVRRWQPLEKLRKIARIHEQVEGIKQEMQSIEVSPKELDAKQRMVISETIMNLLLQLDTIQGLHQTVREARKMIAKELVCLQEKLDILSRQATTGDSVQEVEESTDSVSDNQATCGESLSTVTRLASEQLSDEKCIIESESKAEADTEQGSHDDSATPDEAQEPVPEGPAEILKDVVVSVANKEYEDASMGREEQPDRGAGASVESKLIDEKSSHEPKESVEPLVCKEGGPVVSPLEKVAEAPPASKDGEPLESVEPLVSPVEKELEVAVASKDGVPILGLEDSQQNNGDSSTGIEAVKEAASDPGAGHDTEVNLEDTTLVAYGKAELGSIAKGSIKDQEGKEEVVAEIEEPSESNVIDTDQRQAMADGVVKSKAIHSNEADTEQEDAAEGITVKSDILCPESAAPESSIVDKNFEDQEGLADTASVNNSVPESQDQVSGGAQGPSEEKVTSGLVAADDPTECEGKPSASETHCEATADVTAVVKEGEAGRLHCKG